MKKYKWLRLLTLGLVVFQTFAFGFKGNIALAVAPDTLILSHPSATTSVRTGTFEFEASDTPATFQCSLDGGAYAACTSPYITSTLDYGSHTFGVKATNATDETDASPATFTWDVSPFDGGDGSSEAPFQIIDCDQLMYMSSFPTSYHFILTSDIDCSGKTYTSVGTFDSRFSGTLNGDGHTISNITSTDRGIFYRTEGATIQNFILENSSFSSDGSIGAIAGYADLSTNISNVHVYNTEITASAGYSGGIVGFLGNSSTVSGASFIGGFVKSPGHNYIGGIASEVELATVENVVSKTHLEGDQTGGIAGTMDYPGSLITKAYSASTFDALGTNNGGLVGSVSDGTVSHSFSVSDMTVGGGTLIGGMFGTAVSTTATLSDLAFDQTLAGTSDCAGSSTGPVDCTVVNTDGSQGNYFKNNSTHAPLDTWSFGPEGTWHVNATDYPSLTPVQAVGLNCDGPSRTLTTMSAVCTENESGWGTNTWEAQYKLTSASEWTNITLTDPHSGTISTAASPDLDYNLRVRFTNDSGTTVWLEMTSELSDTDSDGANDLYENNAPRGGDGNGDSQHDQEQANVYSTLNPLSGKYTTLVTSCDNNFNVQIGAESSEHADADYSYPEGLVGFVGRDCGAPGSTVNVEIYFYGDYDASKFVLRKSSGDGTYRTIDSAVLTSTTIGGQNVLKATYQVVDGGALDADGTADGNISDPVGLAQSTITVPDTGLQHKNVTPSVLALISGIIALAYVSKKQLFAERVAK